MIRLVLCCLLFASPAFAQQAQQSPEIRALQTKLMQEINSSLACTTQAIGIEQQLVAAQAEIKALKEKYEPAK